MKNKMVIVGAVVVIALIAVVIMLLSGDGGDAGKRQAQMGSDKDPTVTMEGGDIPIVRDDPQEALDRYKRWAQYPPTTRPLHAGMVDLLEPYNADNPALGVIASPAKGCEPVGLGAKCAEPAKLSPARCKLTPEASISVGKADFRVFLYCFNSSDPKNPRLPIKNIKSKVYIKLDRKLTPSLPPIAAGDDGSNGDAKAGDLLYTFLVRPTQKDWGNLYLETEFEVEGRPHVQRADWFSTPHTVATFGTNLRDSARGGHLFIDIPINVSKPGFYKIDANLQQKDGDKQFVASATWEGQLAAGAQNVPLRFWGKVIRDREINGPYIVRNIRGRRDNSPVTPDMLRRALESGQPLGEKKHTEPLYEYIRPAGNFETQSYEAREFTDKEWDSPQKQRRIKYLESVAKGER